MVRFRFVNSIDDINLYNDLSDSNKFDSKNRVVDAKGQTVGAEYQGNKYCLISKKERYFSCFERMKRGLLGVIALGGTLGSALSLMSVRKLFFEPKEKIRFAVPVSERNGYDEAYDLDFSIQKVKQLSQELFGKGEKLCLFIGRAPGEPFPGFGQVNPQGETWVSLDQHRNSHYNDEFIPGKQLHLLMDMNDHERLKEIFQLFDIVVVDYSTLKFHDGKGMEKWHCLGKLLRDDKQSQLITETTDFSTIPLDEIKSLMPIADRSTPNYKIGELDSSQVQILV